MKRIFSVIAAASISLFAATSSQAGGHAVTIEFGYPYAHLFDTTYAKIMKSFEKDHPNIKVKFRATYEDYEDATQVVLREAVSNSLPDVTMQGLNRQAIFVEKGIAKSLEPFIAKEANFAKDGYHKAMLDLGTFDGKVHGLPFSVSLPVGYYNMDLMKKAGVSKLPTNWGEVISTCKKLRAGGIKNPIFWGWNITGNWFLQSLMWSQDTPIIKDGKINLGGSAGLKALEQMKAIFDGCKMKNLKWKAALKSFSAGEIAMMYWSTSALGAVERAKGDFELKTYEYPGFKAGPLGLPAGGNSALMVSQSKDPKVLAAAWTFLKYITSGLGAAAVAETTGYMPPNKAANDIILKDFYAANPNKQTAVRQAGLLREWQAYPGDKGLAVTQVLYDAMEGILLGDHTDMNKLQAELQEEIGDMLPK
jgi:multiple sugar transport system substrate-binding protein